MNDRYIKHLSHFIFDDAIELSAEYTEISIDMLVKDDTLREIPFIKTVLNVGKIGIALRDYYLINKFLLFVQALNDGKLTKEEICNHKKLLNNNPKQASKELEFITLILDKFNEVEKSIYCGKLYTSYITCQHGIDWNEFVVFSEILTNLTIMDLEQLRLLYHKNYFTTHSTYKVSSMARCYPAN